MHHTIFTYETTDWLLFFYLYSFLGWVFESTYVSLKQGRPVNRGFLRGPLLPLYGSGAVVMLLVSIPVEKNAVLVYIAGCIGATALEYVTGVTMERLFKVRYWDYSNQKFNYQGQICLSSTLAWGGLTLLMVYVIHKPIEGVVLALPEQAASLLSHMITFAVAIDGTLSVKAALELRDMLVNMADIRQKLETMQKRADVILAFAQEEGRERREAAAFRIRMALERLETSVEKMEESRGKLVQYQSELDSLSERLSALKVQIGQLRSGMSSYSRGLLRGNPTATSRYFQEALIELRERMDQR